MVGYAIAPGDANGQADDGEQFEQAVTLPPDVHFSLAGFPSQEAVNATLEALARVLAIISTEINLSSLDGVTVSYRYQEALSSVDRGHPDLRAPVASDGEVVGIAMALSVVRKGNLRSHLVLNAKHLEGITDPSHRRYQFVAQLLAHECAHVEANQRFDEALPDRGLGYRAPTLKAAELLAAAVRIWDEYVACRCSAIWGEDPISSYKTVLLEALDRADEAIAEAKKDFAMHRNAAQTYPVLLRERTDLLKWAAYLIGTQDGQGINVDADPDLFRALERHGFRGMYNALGDKLKSIFEAYGHWRDAGPLEELGELIDAFLPTCGLRMEDRADGGMRVYIE